MNTKKEFTLSLEELKSMVDSTSAFEQAPSARYVRECGSPIVAKHEFSDGDTLTAYQNGFAVYETYRHRIVVRIDCCGSYIYKTGREKICLSESYFDKLPWTVRLQMEAEDQIALNQKTRALPQFAFGLIENDQIERFEEDDDAKRKVKSVIDLLNERQRKIVTMYYFKDCTVMEVAKELGMTENAVGVALDRIRKRLKKNL